MRGICAHLTVSDFSRHFHYKWRGKETDPLSNSRLSWQLLRFISFRPVTWSSLFYNIVRIHCITQIFCLPFSSGCLQRLHHLLPYSTPPCTNLKKNIYLFFSKKKKNCLKQAFIADVHCLHSLQKWIGILTALLPPGILGPCSLMLMIYFSIGASSV